MINVVKGNHFGNRQPAVEPLRAGVFRGQAIPC
jgi:hypothetical protein